MRCFRGTNGKCEVREAASPPLKSSGTQRDGFAETVRPGSTPPDRSILGFTKVAVKDEKHQETHPIFVD